MTEAIKFIVTADTKADRIPSIVEYPKCLERFPSKKRWKALRCVRLPRKTDSGKMRWSKSGESAVVTVWVGL